MTGNRKTLKAPVRFEGLGIHAGGHSRMVLEPARSGGLRFISEGREIPADGRYLGEGTRGTDLRKDGILARTVEHLLAACAGLGVWDLVLRLEGAEVPGLDGSSAEFVRLMTEAGFEDLGWPLDPLVLEAPVRVEAAGAFLEAWPSGEALYEYHLAYPQYPVVADQRFSYRPAQDSFARDLAPARTFCLESEIQALRQAGLARGGSLETAVVAGPGGYLNTSVRFPDEPCRHKMLDLLGDLALLGRPLRARILADRSGHRLNGALVRAIQARLGLGVS